MEIKRYSYLKMADIFLNAPTQYTEEEYLKLEDKSDIIMSYERGRKDGQKLRICYMYDETVPRNVILRIDSLE